MKTILQSLIIFLLSITIGGAQVEVDINLGEDYVNQVYYKLSTQTATPFAADSWDIAFYRAGLAPTYIPFATRVNDAIGIQVFDASNDPDDWDSVDVANEGDWTELYNSNTEWTNGAFDQASADGTYAYGWGNYNMSNHVIEGDVVFVLKYNDGTYRKFFIESYAAGYTFKYSTWDGSSWSADTQVEIPNTNNPNNTFNYYSLQNNTEVIAEPAATDWDFVFKQYKADYYGDASLFYPVTGVLHSEKVTVAQNEEESGMPTSPSLTYSDEINTIGWEDWKAINMETYAYEVDPTQAYYVKYADGTVYRLYFTAFEGGTTGELTFKFEDITASLGVEDVNNVSFGVYPNPSTNKQINLVYDVSKLSSVKNEVAIYTVTGQKVFQKTLQKESGFYNKQLNLSHLRSGVYLLHFESGDSSVTKKIILQ